VLARGLGRLLESVAARRDTDRKGRLFDWEQPTGPQSTFSAMGVEAPSAIRPGESSALYRRHYPAAKYAYRKINTAVRIQMTRLTSRNFPAATLTSV
jgi:hypothetical protein